MRIMHILNHVQEIGNGIVNVAVDLAYLQAKAGHQVGVVSAGGEYEALLTRYGVRHFQLDQARKPINLIKACRRYRAIVREFQPDIVHAHMMTGVVLARACRGGGLLDRIFSLSNTPPQNKYALVSTVHNEFQRSAVLMGLADRVIAVSKAVSYSMAERGIPQKKLRVVTNGALGSPRTRALEEYLPLPLQRPAITTVAGMYCRKGIAELIAAFEQVALDFPQAHLYLVGNGPDRSVFEAHARSTPYHERIHFEGFQSEPQRYLLATDIFVLASHRDPCPLVLSEAREAGCAIIASNVDGIPEALDGGQAGLLIPPEDKNALATALVQFLTSPKTLHSWRAQAKNNIGWLTAARVNQETLAVYGELTTEE